MAIYHLSPQIIGRSKGKSAVASSAYRAGEKIHDEHLGMTFDYTKKRGVDYTEILAPDHAPVWAHDRGKLWNEVEKIEKSKDAQLARELNIALPKELTRDQQIELIRNYSKEHFADKGMVADLALHHLAGENPHAHIMLTLRPFTEDGNWGAKSKKEYILDKSGEKIKLPSGEFKSRKIDSVDWNKKETLMDWRKEWETHANKALERAGSQERIDHRSLKDQGSKQIPQIHVGVHANAMEKKGIQTERGNINRGIKELNAERDRFNADRRALIKEEREYWAELKAQGKTQPSAPISEPTSKIVQQPSSKKDISDETAKEQPKTFEVIKADFNQTRIELGRQHEMIDKIKDQLRSETDKLRNYKNYDKQISDVEEELGKLSRVFDRREVRTLEQTKVRVTEDMQKDFGETKREHIEQRIDQLTKEKQVSENKLPELKNRYNRAKADLNEYSRASISETTRPPIVQQPRTLEEIKQEIKTTKAEVNRTYEDMRHQGQIVVNLNTKLKSTSSRIEDYDRVDGEIRRVEQKLGGINRLHPFKQQEIKALGKERDLLIKQKKISFGSTDREGLIRVVRKLEQSVHPESKKFEELERKYKQSRGKFDKLTTEAKSLEKNLGKSFGAKEKSTGQPVHDTIKAIGNSLEKVQQKEKIEGERIKQKIEQQSQNPRSKRSKEDELER